MMMDEAFKNKLTVGLSILTLIFLIVSIASCNKAAQQNKARLKEMGERLSAEEKLQELSQNQSSADEKIKKLSDALAAQKDELEIAKKALLQEQMVNQSLQEELTKVSKLKDTLEQNLKEALINNKASSIPKK